MQRASLPEGGTPGRLQLFYDVFWVKEVVAVPWWGLLDGKGGKQDLDRPGPSAGASAPGPAAAPPLPVPPDAGGGEVPFAPDATASGAHCVDDGYAWRKYGEKVIKKAADAPRSYYRCA